MWKYNNTSELYHWGIKGMKWGVRRYQNDDGSLTPAGKRRYSVDLQTFGKKKKKSGGSSNEHLNTHTSRKTPGSTSGEQSKQETQSTQTPGKTQKKQEYDGLKNTIDAVDSFNKTTNNVRNVVNNIPTKPRPRMNLDDMSNKELQDLITRENLERQYNNLFSSPTKGEKAKQKTLEALTIIGALGAVTLTGLQIYNEVNRNRRGD